jgi:hypothetical protein
MNRKLIVIQRDGKLVLKVGPQGVRREFSKPAVTDEQPAPVWRIEIKQTSTPTKRADHLRSALFIEATLAFFLEYVISMLQLDRSDVGLSIEVSTPASGEMSAEAELARKKVKAELANHAAREARFSSRCSHRN